MYVPLWILIPAALLLLWLIARVFGGSRGDMIERQRRSSGGVALRHGPRPGDPDAMSDPAIRAAVESGHKIEAIRLARERFGLGLKEAKELIERQAGM